MAVKFFGRKNAPFLAIFVGVTGAGGRIGGVGCTLVGNVSKEKGTKILVHFSHSLIKVLFILVCRIFSVDRPTKFDSKVVTQAL